MPLFADAPIRVQVRGRIRGRPLEGLASVASDGDGVLVVPLDAAYHPGSPVRIGFDILDGFMRTGPGAVRLLLQGGEDVTASGDPRLADVGADVLARGRVVPEMTRALRTLGGRRGGGGQDAFFQPLLDARRQASAGGDAALDAFAAPALHAGMERTLDALAAGREPHGGAARRSLEARLCDAAAPLLDALDPLEEAARLARDPSPADALRRWREWAQSLQRVFARADAAWIDVRAILEERPLRPGNPSRGDAARWKRST